MDRQSLEELRAEMNERVERARAERAAHVPRRLRPEILDRLEETEARQDEQSARLAALTLSLDKAHEIAEGEPEFQRPVLRFIRGGVA